MRFDVVIPTRGDTKNLKNILKSISDQTFLPNKIFILVDKHLEKDQYDELAYFLVKGMNEDFRHRVEIVSDYNYDLKPGSGVSYIRNFGIDLVQSDFLYFIDDDNIFKSEFFEKCIDFRSKLKNKKNKDLLISPTIMYRDSGISQSQGMSGFNFFLSKVVLNCICDQDYGSVRMIGGNSLFGPTKVFDEIRFDENFKFTYEDLDFSYRVVTAGYPIYVSNLIEIYHMERNKTRLEKSFIGDPECIYEKSKNRILFVRKNGTKLERGLFFNFGMRIQNCWFIALILLMGKGKTKLIKNLFKGQKAGIEFKL